MSRAALALMITAAGCSFLVDPVGVTEATADLSANDAGPTDDLSILDLATSVDSSPDLTSPDLSTRDLVVPDLLCSPPVFPGFGNGASSPYDCRTCGCIVDDFSALSAARWTVNAPAEWTTTIGGGVASMSSLTAGSDNAQLSSDGHFYLDGDFDVLVDYQIISWTGGGGANLASFGPGSTAPTVYAHTYLSGARGYYLQVDAVTSLPPATDDHGTFEITRTGPMICAQILNGPSKCLANAETKRVTLALDVNVNNPGCSSSCTTNCCVQKAEFRNLRLKSGVIVSTP